MKFAYTWGSILVVVAASVTGDILVSLAMKQVGDLGHVYRERGFWCTVKAVMGNGTLWAGVCFMALAFFALLFAPCRPCIRRSNVCWQRTDGKGVPSRERGPSPLDCRPSGRRGSSSCRRLGPSRDGCHPERGPLRCGCHPERGRKWGPHDAPVLRVMGCSSVRVEGPFV
jgi:hypothetical protein